jgi:polysaccharide deacetylase family protein (PEP-CTERM system associated)
MDRHVLSVDLEDPGAVRYRPRPRAPDLARIEQGLAAALALLDRAGARATFFVAGEIAAALPDAPSEIHARGHEVACHGMTHTPLDLLGPAAFRRDLGLALDAFARAGCPVRGFRAPWWSIPHPEHWALGMLREMGFDYDSSIFPVRTTHYGNGAAPRLPYRVAGGSLWEVPPSTVAWGPLRLPGPSGFYCRLYPLGVSRRLRDRLVREGALHLYFHPWELLDDRCVPAMGGGLAERMLEGMGRSRMMERMQRLLAGLEWRPIGEALGLRRKPVQ